MGDTTKSDVRKRSVVVDGRKTSVSLEEPFWNAMKEIASSRRMAVSELVAEIDGGHTAIYYKITTNRG